MLLSEAEDKMTHYTTAQAMCWFHAVGDPVHVEKLFVRNLGGPYDAITDNNGRFVKIGVERQICTS